VIGAINAVNSLGEAATGIRAMGQNLGSYFPTAVWATAHWVAPALATNVLYANLTDPTHNFTKKDGIYLATSAGAFLGDLAVNGRNKSLVAWVRDGSLMTTVALASYYNANQNTSIMQNWKVLAGTGGLTTVAYIVKRFKE